MRAARARRPDFELWAALLLSIATVLTAWSAFQATKWSGVMSIRFSEANAARTQSAQASAAADIRRTVDVTVLTEWIDAVAEDRREQADFIRERMRDEFLPAFEAWLATDPRSDPGAPPTPFEMPEYRLEAAQESARLASLADRRGQQARDANQQGDDYVLLTVVFASVLFFAGISTKFSAERIRLAALAFGTVLLLAGVAVEITYPVEL